MHPSQGSKQGDTMAEYQREFLVQYLRDISALHLAQHKLQERLVELDNRKCSIENGTRYQEAPKKPSYEAANGVFGIGLGLFLLMCSVLMFFYGLDIVGWLGSIIGILIAVIGSIRYLKVTHEDAKKEIHYNRKLAVYRETQRKRAEETKAISAIADEIRECQTQIEQVSGTLQKVYRANVIPVHHRNMYAAVFLYVWFGTGKSNDLNLALERFVFDEVKEKLDRIIVNERELILSQHFRLAQQRPSPKLQKEYAAMMVQKLMKINLPKEELDPHLAMIASHTATTAYFASANYLKQI